MLLLLLVVVGCWLFVVVIVGVLCCRCCRICLLVLLCQIWQQPPQGPNFVLCFWFIMTSSFILFAATRCSIVGSIVVLHNTGNFGVAVLCMLPIFQITVMQNS